MLTHRRRGDDTLDDIATPRNVVHRFEEHVFQNGTKSAGAGRAFERQVGDRLERVFFNDQLDAVHGELVGKGVREGLAPITLGDVARISMILDPDGNWIELSRRASIVGNLS